MMTKLKGRDCPKCLLPKCFHRCDNCEEELFWKHPHTGLPLIGKNGRKIPMDEHGNTHNSCMRKGTVDGKWHNKDYKGNENYIQTKDEQWHEYLRYEAKLGKDNYWHLFIDGKYRGPIEKAKPEDYISWSPKP